MKAGTFEQRVAASDHFLTAEEVNSNIGYLGTKRIIDIMGAIFALFVFLPIILIVAILIKIDNPQHPIFLAGPCGKE